MINEVVSYLIFLQSYGSLRKLVQILSVLLILLSWYIGKVPHSKNMQLIIRGNQMLAVQPKKMYD